MDAMVRKRLFDASNAFENPVVRWITIVLAGVLAAAPILFWVLGATGAADGKLRKDLWDRYKSWLVFIPLMLGPVLLGAAWVIVAVGVLGLFCYNEFARATGLFRERIISLLVVVGILAITCTVFDHWNALFAALVPLTIGLLAAATLLSDRPKGYIQRLALGIMAFLFFCVCFGYLGCFANDPSYRVLLMWLITCVELNDIFAYICGKSFGRRKLAPQTSPNKTVGGAVGALIATTGLAAILGHFVFQGTPLDKWWHLVLLGIIISAGGQIGDLTLSSIKRDLGIKDWSNAFPGHGGLLDRFNSLLFVSPAVYHYVAYVRGIGADQPQRILTG